MGKNFMEIANMTFERCAITGYPLKPGELSPVTGTIIEYTTKFVGHVKIELSVYILMLNSEGFERDILSGISKNRTLAGEDPILYTEDFVRNGYKALNPPTTFTEKAAHFLRYLYNFGGKENKVFEFQSTADCMIAYAAPEEFVRIIDHLEQVHMITIGNTQRIAEVTILYQRVKITSSGREEAEKGLPKMPLFGLVSQEISTGDNLIDQKINHARELFFSKPESMNKMRSACETLSYVLEPIREDLKSYFSTKDVSDFFQLVNTFDIRHNKDNTKSLVYQEQLEWLFYTLLNTLNAYYKLKSKGL